MSREHGPRSKEVGKSDAWGEREEEVKVGERGIKANNTRLGVSGALFFPPPFICSNQRGRVDAVLCGRSAISHDALLRMTISVP